jgi:hypothetical protein
MLRRLALGLVVLVAAAAGYFFLGRTGEPAVVAVPPPPAEASTQQVHQFCGACHAYPPPDTFPRAAWRKEVKQGYDFYRDSRQVLAVPSAEAVARYYESRAPLELPPLSRTLAAHPSPVRWERLGLSMPGQPPSPAVSNVNLVHLFDKRKLDILVCDARMGRVFALKPYEQPPAWRLLGALRHPAHAEVVDLDGDGIKDILVADLGSFSPTDDRVGSVVWLRGAADGSFAAIPLLTGVGRVADVQAADFRGTGKMDLVVAVFGWRNTGEILFLENRTTDWTHPVFVPRVLDDRHGTIHVPVGDLTGDGRPDIVALISQEHETIVAFLNEGGGRFRKETIYSAPHPAFGSSGIQLVDLNKDGRLDVLYTNGDVLDRPYLLKPYHGIQWLENRGAFPFTHHPLAGFYGAHRAVAVDVDGDGDLDILAVSLLPPPELFPARRAQELDSIILLEQTAPGQFVRHVLESGKCDHVTCAAGDLYGDGRIHLVTGNFCLSKTYTRAEGIEIWKSDRRGTAPGSAKLN